MNPSKSRPCAILRHMAFVAVILLSLLATGCDSGTYLQPCHTTRCIGGGVWVSFSHSISSVNAWSIYETREVDPDVYAHDSSSTPTGTITVTLNNGSTVNYSGNLYLDTGTSVAPTRSGHTVLVYRPTDPSGLQAFIDQYKDQAASVNINSLIKLEDVSDGLVSSSVVDFKTHYNSALNYVGSANSTPPSYEPFNQDI